MILCIDSKLEEYFCKRWLVYPSCRPKLNPLETARFMAELHEGRDPWRDCQSHWVLLQFIGHLGWLWGLNAIWYRNLSFQDQEEPWLKYPMRVRCLKLLGVFFSETVMYHWATMQSNLSYRDPGINYSSHPTHCLIPTRPFIPISITTTLSLHHHAPCHSSSTHHIHHTLHNRFLDPLIPSHANHCPYLSIPHAVHAYSPPIGLHHLMLS